MIMEFMNSVGWCCLDMDMKEIRNSDYISQINNMCMLGIDERTHEEQT
jgi:hypothetical protein